MEAGIIHEPQGRKLFPEMTIADNLRLGAYRQAARDGYQQQLHHVEAYFPRLKERYAQRAGTLSGGEQQMLAIGRALEVSESAYVIESGRIVYSGTGPELARRGIAGMDTHASKRNLRRPEEAMMHETHAMKDIAGTLTGHRFATRALGRPISSGQTAAVGIGIFLPPLGVHVLMAVRFAGISIYGHSKVYSPYLVALLVGLLLVISLPERSLFLPRMAGYIH